MKKKIIIIRKNFKHLKIHVLLAALVVATVTATATATATAIHLKIQLCSLFIGVYLKDFYYTIFLEKILSANPKN